MPDSESTKPIDLLVAGGGAAGFFAAVTAAEANPDLRIVIVEKSAEVLGKVKISGGGRCNVTHACFDPRELVEAYPRGAKQLIGPFHRWGPADTMAFFEDRKVPLKIEDDDRIFPVSDVSQSVIDCLVHAARRAEIKVRTGTAIEAAEKTEDGEFSVTLNGGETILARRLLLTLGGIRNRTGAEIAAGFGHTIHPAAPSLFTFKIEDDPRIEGLQGLSVANGRVSVTGTKLAANGPVLVTHWGLSGPGILRVSAWGARELQETGYHFGIAVNWCGPQFGREEILERFEILRAESPRRAVENDPQFGIPSRLWKNLVEAAGAGGTEVRWPHLERKLANKLAGELFDSRFRVTGKSMYKDEFVTCGGVELREVNFKTMESRLASGLYFAGEILDIDGITGGFNFQAAWTTGRIAGEAVAAG
ncbi:MAG: aminoacetone oxidase family FAD-binding enzyme [Verrucomicrobiales bacterium]|nr:aminoacetone oxidase family FAD-binding enzyme [Verrucomicrobiales bacterium]